MTIEPAILPDEICLSEPVFWQQPDREARFARLRRERPVSWQEEPKTIWSDGGRGYWAITRWADVREVSKKTAVFSSGEGTELVDLPPDVARAFSGMINMDAPEHTQLRAIVNAAFTPREIGTLEQLVRNRARQIVDAVSERGECDFATDIADALPTMVICDLLGIPEADRKEVAAISRVTHPLGDPEFGTFTDAYGAARALIDYGKTLMGERRETSVGDLTTALATEVASGRLDPDDAGTYFMVLITAGIETTGAALAHGLLALDADPDSRREWQSEFEPLAATAVDEILRWSTPVVHFRRTAMINVELGGQRISAGDKVVLFYNSANRDEDVFAEPQRFDIRRKPNPHVTFGGGGVHFCLGAHLARLEMRVIFRELFERLPDISVSAPPSTMHSMFFNGVKSLPCAFTPEAPVAA